MKNRCSVLLLFVLCSCGRQPFTITEVWDDPLYVFDDFPDSLFLSLYFDQPIIDSRQTLVQNNFQLIDSSGSWRYWNSEDSNEVILPALENLHSFKLIMKSTEIFKSLNLLHAMLQHKSSASERNDGFSIYTYEQKALSFKVSVFEQKDLIRLNFEEQMRK